MLEDWQTKGLWLVFGALLSWFLQQYRIWRSEDIELVKEHIKDLEKFRDVAQEYWLQVPENDAKHAAAAAKVRAAHAATTLASPEIMKLLSGVETRYQDLSVKLFSLATGGSFESKRDSIDALRAIEIYDTCAQIIHEMRMLRRDLNSVGRLISAFPAKARNFGT